MIDPFAVHWCVQLRRVLRANNNVITLDEAIQAYSTYCPSSSSTKFTAKDLRQGVKELYNGLSWTAVGTTEDTAPSHHFPTVLTAARHMTIQRLFPPAVQKPILPLLPLSVPSSSSSSVKLVGPCKNPACKKPHSSPQWRKGPPLYPILCNACGTRWARRGSLALN